MSTEKQNLDLILTTLAAANVTAFAIGSVPVEFPGHYTEVHVTERYSPAPYMSGQVGMRYWRVLTRAIGTSYNDAQQQRANTAAALEGIYLTLGSVVSTPVSRALSDDPISRDGDPFWSGLTEWSYVL